MMAACSRLDVKLAGYMARFMAARDWKSSSDDTGEVDDSSRLNVELGGYIAM